MSIAWATNPISSAFSALCLPLGLSSALCLWVSLQIVSGESQSFCCPLSSLHSFLRRVRLSHPLSCCSFLLLCRESSPLPTGSLTCHCLQRAPRRDSVWASSP